jgi:hypothetical protein
MGIHFVASFLFLGFAFGVEGYDHCHWLGWGCLCWVCFFFFWMGGGAIIDYQRRSGTMRWIDFFSNIIHSLQHMGFIWLSMHGFELDFLILLLFHDFDRKLFGWEVLCQLTV